jgi:hypothetical protein
MKIYKITREEAIELIKFDEEVNKDKSLYGDMTPEEKKAIKKATSTGTRKVTKDKKPRERKENVVKKNIIADLVKFLEENSLYENVMVANAERQIAFSIGESKFELTLVQKREKK